MARILDASVPDEALSPVERAARTWRAQMLAELGGRDQVPAWRVARLNAATESKILMDVLGCYVFDLIAKGGLVDRKRHRMHYVGQYCMRIANRCVRQLRALEGGE